MKKENAMHLHCAKCVRARPVNVAMKEWTRVEVMLAPEGLIIWCTRHNEEIVELTPGRLAALMLNPPECEMCKAGIKHEHGSLR